MFFCVPRFHSGGETVHATEFHEEWGGKGFNQAVAAARQGAKVSFLGKVGNEADSRAGSDFCEREGIASVVYYSDPSVLPTVTPTVRKPKSSLLIWSGRIMDSRTDFSAR